MAFVESYQLRKHFEGVHLMNRLHVCDDCGKSFYKKGQLVKHQESSACPKKPETTYVCQECGEEFFSLKDCQNHVKIQHNPDNALL